MKGEEIPMEFFRVANSDMYGADTDEKFFVKLENAEKDFEERIKKAKEDEDTLSDEECVEENMSDKNFVEFEFKKESVIREVTYFYGITTNDERGHSYSTYPTVIRLTKHSLSDYSDIKKRIRKAIEELEKEKKEAREILSKHHNDLSDLKNTITVIRSENKIEALNALLKGVK